MTIETGTNRKIRWLPLEANPEVWNKIIHNNGVDSTYSYTDVYGFDPELLAMIPRPCEALIFLFPITEKYEAFREEEETHLKIREQNISPNLMFYDQTIGNACGTMALLHSLANNDHLVGPGVFRKILDETKNMSPSERAEYLEGCEELANIHKLSAQEGQTEAPDISEQILLHFICFVNVDNHLYELDGRRPFPINHGKCTDLVEDAAKLMRQMIERDPGQTQYSAIALTKTEA